MTRGAFRIRGWAIVALLFCASGSVAGAGLTLRVGDQKGGNQSLLDAAGEAGGTPYKIEWSEFPAAAPLLEALNAGAIDVGYVGNAPFLFAYATGVPARVISVVQQNSDGLAIVVPAKSSIRNAADLKGRRIATGRGSIGHYLVLAVLERAGMRAQDVNLVFLGPIDARTALSSGAVDAWATWEPYTSMVELFDGARRVADGKGSPADKGYLVAGVTAIRDKRAALEDFAKRLSRARQWALEHTDQYANAWAKITGSPAPVAKKWFSRAQIRSVPIDDALVADQQSVVDLYAKAGVIKSRFLVNDAFDRSFHYSVESSERQ